MKNYSFILKIDLTMQYLISSLLGVLLLLAIPERSFIIYVFLLYFILGCYQWLSGLILGNFLNDIIRKNYCWLTFYYIIFLLVGSVIWEVFVGRLEIFALVIFIILIPSGIAIWYINYTKNFYRFYEKGGRIRVVNSEGLDDVLDVPIK